MSDLYAVRVAARPDERTLDLDIQVVHPDAMHIPATPGFALMLLHDRAEGDAALAAEIDLATIMDGHWASAHARAFVSEVELLSTANEPPAAALDDHEHAYWRNSKRWLSGRLRIRVTHPAWLAHVPRAWDSAAYDPADSYDACPPASPDDVHEYVVEAAIEHSDGFLPVPRLLLASLTGPGCPELLWVPRHGARAYEPSERLVGADITGERLAAWLGKPLVFQIDGGERVECGVLTRVHDDVVSLTTLSPGGRMTQNRSLHALAWIGLAAFRRGLPRLPAPLELDTLLDFASPAAVCEQVDGCEASLRVYELASSGGGPVLGSAALALRLIAIPAQDEFGRFDRATSKLGRTLRRQMARRGHGWEGELYSGVAWGLLESFEVAPPSEPRSVALGELSRAEQIAFIEQRRWPAWTVRVRVSDEAWVEHLAGAEPWSVDNGSLDEPDAWDDEPLRWDADDDEDEDDDEDDDDEDDADEDDAEPRSTLRRHFEVEHPTRGISVDPADPRSIVHDHGAWDDVRHKLARDHFHDACKQGNVELVRAYLALGIDGEWAADISLETPLIRAAEGNQPEVIRVLAAAGVDLQKRDGSGDTAIMTAVNWGAQDALVALFEVGADPDVPGPYDNFALVEALGEHPEAVEALLAGGASPSAGAATGSCALQWCIREGDESRLRELLAREGVDPNVATAEGDTLLHLAVVADQHEIVELLLEQGADASRRNAYGWRPADVAAFADADALAERLVEAGGGATNEPLLAYFRGLRDADLDAVEAALAAGIAIEARDAKGKTGLMLAVAQDNLALVECLLVRGADLAARTGEHGEYGVLRQAESTVMRRRLLEAGTPASYRDAKGVLRQPALEAVLEQDDHALLEFVLGPQVRGLDLSDLSALHSSLVWGDYEDRLDARAATLRRLGQAGADLVARADDGQPLLHGYIRRGFDVPALALIEAGTDLEAADRNFVTPLLQCCEAYSDHEQQANIARALLDAGADASKCEWLSRGAWELATGTGNQAIVDMLEQRFEQTLDDALAERGRAGTPRHALEPGDFETLARRTTMASFLFWLRRRDHEIVRGSLAGGFDPNPPERNAQGLRPGVVPLVAAVEAGDLEMIDILLRGGALPDRAQVYGQTALSYAASEQRLDIVERLLAAGADPEPFDEWGDTPLRSAAAHGNLGLLDMLTAAGAHVQPRASGRHPLHAAVYNGHFEAAQWLVARAANLDAREPGRTTALHEAIERDQAELALALLAAGCEVDVQTSDEQRVTPLILATKKGDVELVRALLERGADPHVKDADGQSAIDHASYRDELAQLFPAGSGGPRSFERVERELPALLRAVHEGDFAALEAALDEGVDATNYRGDTALMLATAYGRVDMVDALLDAGANVQAKNAMGDTAWSYAFVSGQDALRKRYETLGVELGMDGLNQMAGQAMRRDAAREALSAGDVGRVAKLIDALELDVDFLTPGVRPLRLALDRGDVAMLRLLAAKGADASLSSGGGTLRELAEELGLAANL